MAEFRIETRTFRPGDEELLLAGLERASRAAGAGPSRARAELEWRYARAPEGACVAFAHAAEPGIPVAGIAATRRRVRFQGTDLHWLEVGDLFHDFSHGRGLARATALVALGRAFAEAFGGFAPEKHPVVYGVPNRRAHRIGLARLEWEVLRSENELVLDLARPGPASTGQLEIEEPQRFPEEVVTVFERVAAARPALLVRDARTLNWRYAEAPGGPAALALARRGGIPVGMCVLGRGRLLDWCVPPDEPDAGSALLAWARGRARADGASELTAVFPDSAPEWLAFQQAGFRVRGTREYLCFRSFQRPAIMSWVFHNWSYTRGDTLRDEPL